MDYLLALLIAIGLNLSVFVFAYWRQTDKLTDLTYASTFIAIAVALYIMCTDSVVSALIVGMVAVWAIRLGVYLGIRIHKMGKDRRFDAWRANFWKFGRFWLLQGASVWIIMAPAMIVLVNMPAQFNLWSLVGLVVWAIGLAIETIADQQKYQFLNNPKNKGKWIASGLWGWSRHPNYFGEIMVWLGVYLFAIPYLSFWLAIIALASPLWISGLLIFGTGLPQAEKRADAKWGKIPAYRKYKKHVPILIPKRLP